MISVYLLVSCAKISIFLEIANTFGRKFSHFLYAYLQSVFKKMLSPSTILVYKGDSGDWPFHFAFISFHMHNYGVKRCESKVERLRATHMLANHLSIAISAMSVKRESIFSKKLSRDAGERARARDGAPRLCISLSHLRISSSQLRDSLSP